MANVSGRRAAAWLAVVVALAVATAVTIGVVRRPRHRTDLPPACVVHKLPALDLAWRRYEQCDLPAGAPGCWLACAVGGRDYCLSLAFAAEAQGREPESLSLYSRACLRGSAMACTNYAAHLWSNELPGDQRCATALFVGTCAVGDSMGCGMVGRATVSAATTSIGDELAHGLLSGFCAELDGPPCRMLAYYLEGGRFKPSGDPDSDELMRRACAGGDRDACGAHERVEDTFTDRGE
ncbi:MAG: hypothetical protein KBG28_12610 [Kofleriaceae bacterium]|nr:hypothetical protein [Kofleriaceae bacterium]